jgi:hypothetical protein
VLGRAKDELKGQWGREMGEFVLNNYTEVKAVTTAP